MNIAQRIAVAATLVAAGVFLLSGYWFKGCYTTDSDWVRFAPVKGIGLTAGILLAGSGLTVFLGVFRKRPKDGQKPGA